MANSFELKGQNDNGGQDGAGEALKLGAAITVTALVIFVGWVFFGE